MNHILFSNNDTALPSDHPLCFQKNLIDKISLKIFSIRDVYSNHDN